MRGSDLPDCVTRSPEKEGAGGLLSSLPLHQQGRPAEERGEDYADNLGAQTQSCTTACAQS